MKKGNKGFTLIELLAVIIILSVIALIAVPTIMGIIEETKASAAKDSAYGFISAAELYYAEKTMTDGTAPTTSTVDNLKLKGTKPTITGGITYSDAGKITANVKFGEYTCTIEESILTGDKCSK